MDNKEQQMNSKQVWQAAAVAASKVGVKLGKGWTDTAANGDKLVAWNLWNPENADALAAALQPLLGAGCTLKRTGVMHSAADRRSGGEYVRVRVKV